VAKLNESDASSKPIDSSSRLGQKGKKGKDFIKMNKLDLSRKENKSLDQDSINKYLF
jgi:hypothetical protein